MIKPEKEEFSNVTCIKQARMRQLKLMYNGD